MTVITVDAKSISKTPPINLSFHVVTTLNVSADDARRAVNRQIIPTLGTGLIAHEPALVVADDYIVWRVPIVLSLPGLGDIGQVGSLDVDAHTGELLLNNDDQQRIIDHARRLYTGATLPTA